MMIQLSDLGQVYLVCGKRDMRQGMDPLAYLLNSQLAFQDRFSSFVVAAKIALKPFYWDGQGFWI